MKFMYTRYRYRSPRRVKSTLHAMTGLGIVDDGVRYSAGGRSKRLSLRGVSIASDVAIHEIRVYSTSLWIATQSKKHSARDDGVGYSG